jgi:hypothetical protein
MNDFKSVQDLIVKAALYDGVSTTISAAGLGDIPVLKITFSKGNRRSATNIDMATRFVDHEHMALYCCKDALHQLLWGRYDEIKVNKEN